MPRHCCFYPCKVNVQGIGIALCRIRVVLCARAGGGGERSPRTKQFHNVQATNTSHSSTVVPKPVPFLHTSCVSCRQETPRPGFHSTSSTTSKRSKLHGTHRAYAPPPPTGLSTANSTARSEQHTHSLVGRYSGPVSFGAGVRRLHPHHHSPRRGKQHLRLR